MPARARRGVHAHELGAIDGEHAERVRLAQVVLRRERQLDDVGDRAEAALDARGQRAAVERDALGAAGDDGAQALELESVELGAVSGFGGAIPDHTARC